MFDPAPMVVEVLNTQAPETALDSLKAKKRDLTQHVSDISHEYSSQFAQTLSGYRDALTNFHDARASLSQALADLSSAKQHVKPEIEGLQAQWLNTLSLEEEVTLLDRINKVARAPAEADALSNENRVHEALLVLHDASSLPADVASIPALRELQSDISSSFDSLRSSVLMQLQQKIAHPAFTNTHSSFFVSSPASPSRHHLSAPARTNTSGTNNSSSSNKRRSRNAQSHIARPMMSSPGVASSNHDAVDVHALSVRTWLNSHSALFFFFPA